MKQILTLLLLLPLALFGYDVLTFQTLIDLEREYPDREELTKKLKQWDKHEVEIRGFVYQDEEGNWILSCQPDVPSCCRSKDNVCHQIVLEGEVGSPKNQSIADVRGQLYLSENQKQSNKLLRIRDPHVKPVEGSSISMILAFAGIALLAVYIVGNRLRKR